MIDLTGLDFSEDVLLGIEAGIEAAEVAVCERQLVIEAAICKQQRVSDAFGWLKKDASRVTYADLAATAKIIKLFKQKYGPIPVVSEEGLSDRPSIEAMILKPENYPAILDAPLALVVDGIDGTLLFGSGELGCGVLFAGVRFGKTAWTVFVGLPTPLETAYGIYHGMVCVAETGKGVWCWDIRNKKWKCCQIKPLLAGQKPKISLALYHNGDARYAPLRGFLEWLDPELSETHSIGQAMADVACLELGQFFLHGDLYLHDRLGAEVMIPEAGGKVFHFMVSPDGKFSLRYGGVDKDYCAADSRIGLGFGLPKVVDAVENFVALQGGQSFSDQSPFKITG